MSDRNVRRLLVVIAMVMAGTALAYVIEPPSFARYTIPNDVPSLAARIGAHPTDWIAASALTEHSLDWPAPNRMAMWRASYELASRLAPHRTEPPNAFARAAFFHWSELSDQDRKDVLAAYEPLMYDEPTFFRMGSPLFQLTGSLAMLRRAQPHTQESIAGLCDTAAANGLFEDYRQLRTELQQKRNNDFITRVRNAITPTEIIALLPRPPYHAEDEPTLVAALEALHRRPLDEDPARPQVIDALVDYSLRHNLQPLDGLEAITRKEASASETTREELSRRLGLTSRAQQIELSSNKPRGVVAPQPPEWAGLCEVDVCQSATRELDAAHAISLTMAPVRSDETPAYVEIYVDDALRSEGEVGQQRDFAVPVGVPGRHRVEVHLANPLTRNRAQRRVRIVSVQAL